jgi:hypothetical protein
VIGQRIFDAAAEQHAMFGRPIADKCHRSRHIRGNPLKCPASLAEHHAVFGRLEPDPRNRIQ